VHVPRARIPNSGAHLRIELDADPVISQGDTAIGGLRGGIASRQRSNAKAHRAGRNTGDGGQLEKSASAGTQLLHAAGPLEDVKRKLLAFFLFHFKQYRKSASHSTLPSVPAETASPLAPLYLLADSQLLFWKSNGKLLLETALDQSEGDSQRAAYIGASNGDRREYYEIFAGAMQAAGINDRRQIYSSFSAQDREYLESAHLIVLSGGEVRSGWEVFKQTGMKDVILGRYAQGAVLVGISAGAVQLGRQAVIETAGSFPRELLDMFNLVPAIVDVHDESNDWARLSSFIHLLEGTAVGLGIPSGGGVIAHPDGTIEPLRRPAHEFRFSGVGVTRSLLCPPDGD
jgi:cyanophycinase